MNSVPILTASSSNPFAQSIYLCSGLMQTCGSLDPSHGLILCAIRSFINASLCQNSSRMRFSASTRVENAASLQRIKELQEIVERIDFSWEQGFLIPDEYLEKRERLQKEMESFRPIDYIDDDELMEAADLLENFNQYWVECENFEKTEEARQQLVAKIVDKVFVYDDKVVAVALHGDFSIVLNNDEAAPIEVIGEVEKAIKKGADSASADCTQFGSDGDRSLVGLLILAAFDDVLSHRIVGIISQRIA
jgi:hypothetical protein